MVTEKQCSRCGAAWLAVSPDAHCPHCLAEIALRLPPEQDAEAAGTGPLPRRFGDYELVEEVARGGMGVVYRAWQLSLKRTVALKMILTGEFAGPEALRRFRQEAEAAAHLQHPFIVAIHEVGEEQGQCYFTMDLVEGRTLAEMVQAHPLPARRAATYLKSIAEAVDYAHQHGIVHRDLKPSNILVDAFDHPRITDFGLARPLDQVADLNLTGQAIGSPGYISPEQA